MITLVVAGICQRDVLAEATYAESAPRRIGDITSIVGMGPAFSGDGGSAIVARLSHPERVALDSVGNLYIADRGNHQVRKVDTAGNITTLAGSGSQGFCGDGGPAVDACLNTPTGVAVNDAGEVLYIADSANRRVRAVDLTTGIISTAAGTGDCCFSGDGALLTNAALASPIDAAVNQFGDLLIADLYNHVVRRVSGAANSPTCKLDVELDYDVAGTLVIDFNLGTLEPARWDVWLVSLFGVDRLWSFPIPIIDRFFPFQFRYPFRTLGISVF